MLSRSSSPRRRRRRAVAVAAAGALPRAGPSFQGLGCSMRACVIDGRASSG
ncbi:hypothetical protein HMPREF1979_02239 [Actinomyces johnsonii F0542]|uniref:Uncharacterized protein n=1 Tax=Actinomyces johnsonii F0542 TaxID=1321818 RepID=U1QKT6_9ACTO|nr:hypothetical protein HMPREF1979_02239 [Actinomyces johnsonii F0542]